MKTNNLKYLLFGFIIVSLSLNACKKDELPDVEEEELITTISLTFTNTTDANDVKTITYKDLDGDGGNAPIVSNLNLKANQVYSVAISSILNETGNPADDIRAEVIAEKDDHLFVYKTSGANLTFSNLSTDNNNLPFGLTATATTTSASTGTFTIILRHQPGTKDGTELPGSADLEATFPVSITN